ncbi:MAG: helix-turn-helix domain-containing protein [Phreatobacter sp.]
MPVQSLVFSAHDRDEADGFGAYHDLYASGSDVGLTGGPFAARVHAHRFERMIVFDRYNSGVSHGRDAARVRRDGFDHIALQLLISGELAGGRPGDERALAPGEIILFDMTQPQRTRADDARLIAVSLAREVVEAAAPVTRSLHGAILPEAASGLLGDFMISLARHGDTLSAGTASRAGRMVAELLAAALGEGNLRPASASSAEQLMTLKRERAEAAIEARLADPGLDVEAVASVLGVSRSVLYRLFEPSGGVAQYIQHRRLERLRAALRRLNETRSVAALAYDHGFASESHCSRAFRAAYGLPPGQYRSEMNRARLARAAGDGSARGVLASWNTELY